MGIAERRGGLSSVSLLARSRAVADRLSRTIRLDGSGPEGVRGHRRRARFQQVLWRFKIKGGLR